MTRRDPDLELAGRAEGSRDRYRFDTARGVASPDAFRPAELLLVEAIWDRPPGTLLVPEANYGVVPTVLADVADRVVATESSARTAALLRRNARRNDAAVDVALLANLAVLGEPAGVALGPDTTADAVAYAPTGYTPIDVARQRIADSLAALCPGGTCYVAAARDAGRSRFEDTLEALAADVDTVASRDGAAVLAATRPHAFDPPTFVEPRTLTPTVDGVDLELVSVPGLFAAAALDHGTRLLCETASVPAGARVLDCCCGYGAIGAYAAATVPSATDSEVVLTDDDRVATACAERSLDRTGVEATVHTADCTDATDAESIDLALVNPPTHAGAEVLHDLFSGIHAALVPGGECALVHHEDLDLSAHLAPFGATERVATGEEHAVVRATR